MLKKYVQHRNNYVVKSCTSCSKNCKHVKTAFNMHVMLYRYIKSNNTSLRFPTVYILKKYNIRWAKRFICKKNITV